MRCFYFKAIKYKFTTLHDLTVSIKYEYSDVVNHNKILLKVEQNLNSKHTKYYEGDGKIKPSAWRHSKV